MNTQQFLAEFGHIANAANGIELLRQMIYQLAITGALTPHRNTDQDAGYLLARVEEQRQKLIHAKEYKRMLQLEAERVDPPESITLPPSWRWTRLLDIGEINPRNDAPDDQLSAFVPMSGVPHLHRAAIVSETRRWGDIKKGYTHFANGDVVLAKITPCFENGKAAVVADLPGEGGIGAGTTELHVFRPFHVGILPAYVYLFLRSPLFTVDGEKNMTGTAGQKRLPTDYFATRPFPLPPSEEQSRIVAKVDELLALCDRLQKQQQDRRHLQNELRHSILHALAITHSPNDMQTSWLRLHDNFERLFSEQADVHQFRDVIFDLSLRGLLLADSVLTVKSEHNLQETRPLPKGWTWSNLDEISEYITSGSRGWKGYISGAGDSFIRSQDIRQDALVFDNPAFVTLPERAEGKRTLVQPGDLLLTITGGNVGRCAVVPKLNNKAYVSQHVALIRLHEPKLGEFIHFWMINTYGGRTFLSRYIYGDKPGLNLTQVGSVPVPIPRPEDLPGIMESLRKHQSLCDELAKQLEARFDLASKLAVASVSAVIGMAIGQDEDATVKAPQTELIAPLRLGTSPDVRAQAPLATILARHKGEMTARDLWQRFGGEIDAFYAQLKIEVAHNWIAEPEVAQMFERPAAETAKA